MRTRTLRLAAGAGVLAAIALPNATTGNAAAARATLAGNRPTWATGAAAGRVSAAQQLEGAVYLRLRNEAGATQLAAAVSDPASASYRHFLTAAQYSALFAPTQAAVDHVSAYLRSQGLTVTDVPSNRLYVGWSGSAATAAAAFGTSIGLYAHAGALHMAPSTDPSVPAALAAEVDSVAGLDDASAHPNTVSGAPSSHPDNFGPPPLFRNAPPCSEYWGQKLATQAPPAYGETQPDVPCGYGPAQLRSAYHAGALVDAGFDGRGQTVAIVDAFASHTLRADVNEWSSRHNVPQFSAGQLTEVLAAGLYRAGPNNPCGPSGWSGEQALDLEAVHGLAPGATIIYEGAKNCQDHALIASLNDVVANQRAQIISNSYGGSGENTPANLVRAYERVFKQAAAEGIGIFFSSGDSGDESQNPAVGKPEPDYPASDPWVTAVGGTSLAVGKTGDYKFEVGWGTLSTNLDTTTNTWNPAPPGTTFLYGSGGGTSQVFPEPWYQKGVVPSALVHRFSAGGGRVVPDIAAVGDVQTGYQIGLTQLYPDGSSHYSQYRIGGTSLSCPVMAAFEAISDQVSGRPHGFANPAIYRLAGNATALHDVDSIGEQVAVVRTNFANGINPSAGYLVSLRTTNHDESLRVAPGYDDVTGVGTPDVANYARFLGT